MKQDYAKYSSKTKGILEKADKVIYETSRNIKKTNKFLKNLEDNLLIAEAELIANKH